MRSLRLFAKGFMSARAYGCVGDPAVFERGVLHKPGQATPDAGPDAPPRPSVEATITCPACGQTSTASMPDDQCIYFYTCPACQTRLKPLEGDCCVFCSYGDRQCPSRCSG